MAAPHLWGTAKHLTSNIIYTFFERESLSTVDVYWDCTDALGTPCISLQTRASSYWPYILHISGTCPIFRADVFGQ